MSFIDKETLSESTENQSPIVDIQNKGVCVPVHEITTI